MKSVVICVIIAVGEAKISARNQIWCIFYINIDNIQYLYAKSCI